MQNYWSVEVNRLIWTSLIALCFGYLSGEWLLCALGVALAYIGWGLYKLRQLQKWLLSSLSPGHFPDSDGIWEQIAYLINRNQQKHLSRKNRQKKLLLRLNNIISALPDAVVLFDEHHTIQWSNSTAEALLGIRHQRDIGQRIDNLLRAPSVQKILLNYNTEQETHFQSPRDNTITLIGRILPVEDKLWLFNARDISLRIQLQRTRKAFIANASHELRTPLTVISGYLELLESHPDLEASLQGPIEQSRQQTARMQKIIEDMLTLSSLENTDRDTHQQRLQLVDVPLIIQRQYTSITATIAAHSHALTLDIDSELFINGIETEVTSVITNLIENAVKHTPAGTQIAIRWQRSSSPEQACFSVTDNGPGIPSEYIEHLTERFYRIDTGRSREKGGTGLGLSIVKHVMQNHGGQLNITSQSGKTQFLACFPSQRIINE